MDDLLSIRSRSTRGDMRRKRAKASIDLLATIGLLKKVKVEGGFTIHASNVIPELKNARIDAPAGLITIFSTFIGTQIYENDYYLEGVSSKDGLYVFDTAIKEYDDTGAGIGSWVTILLQGQPEDLVLTYLPYAGSIPARFLRNGSFANNEPGGVLGPNSFAYPDTWPTPCLMPDGPLESAWIGVSGSDMIYENSSYSSMYNELAKIRYNSNNSGIGGRTLYSEQKLDPYNPPSSNLFMPVTGGAITVVPIAGFRIPATDASNSDRRFASVVRYKSELFDTSVLKLSEILPPASAVPATHTGDTMPEGLRSIILASSGISGRMGAYHAFSLSPDRSPIVFVTLDLTNTQQGPFTDGPDVAWLEDPQNANDRDWRISCHFIDTETNETWSFTAAQFWDLLRDRVINLTIDADWRTAPSDDNNPNGWAAALTVFDQFFGEPNNNFVTPHDTWTFHADDGNIYAWSRYYGEVKIERTGLVGLADGSIRVPDIVTNNDGVRPTIRYSGKFGESETPRYLCICEKLERADSNEELPQGRKEVMGMYVGTPFQDDSWFEFGEFSLNVPDVTWALCHVRVVLHDFTEGADPSQNSDNIMLLGIVRKRFIDQDSNEIIEYFSAILTYNSLTGGEWAVTGKYPGLDTIDVAFGDRWSAELCLFGDDVLSPKMMQYLSQPFSASQLPRAPYDTYLSGLP